MHDEAHGSLPAAPATRPSGRPNPASEKNLVHALDLAQLRRVGAQTGRGPERGDGVGRTRRGASARRRPRRRPGTKKIPGGGGSSRQCAGTSYSRMMLPSLLARKQAGVARIPGKAGRPRLPRRNRTAPPRLHGCSARQGRSRARKSHKNPSRPLRCRARTLEAERPDLDHAERQALRHYQKDAQARLRSARPVGTAAVIPPRSPPEGQTPHSRSSPGTHRPDACRVAEARRCQPPKPAIDGAGRSLGSS